MLALLLIGALADTPYQARLLTRDEIAETPVHQLSVSQLELERDRVEEPRVVWPGNLLLGYGIFGSIVGLGFGAVALGLFVEDRTSYLAGLATLLALSIGSPYALLGIGGGVLTGLLHARRDRYAARHSDVLKRLDAIRYGTARAPIPWSAELADEIIRLADERPGLALPLIIAGLGGGLMGGGGAVVGMLRQNPRASTTDLGVAIGATCVGVLLFGVGLYRAIRVTQERNDIDARIAELKALPPPEGADDYWHF